MRKPQGRWTMPMCARALELREAGLSYAAITRVVNLDFEADIATSTLRRYLRGQGVPPDLRRDNSHHLRRAA